MSIIQEDDSTFNKVWGIQEADVNLQDQITPPIIARFYRLVGGSVLVSEAVQDSYSIEVADATDADVNTYIIMYSTVTDKFYLGRVLSKVGNILTLDSPIDNDFPIGAVVGFGDSNMAVDGSYSRVIFGLRGPAVENPLNLTFDITRIIFSCTTSGSCDLSTFADIAGGLTKGLVLRERNGSYNNIFNVKTNADLAGIMYDMNILQSTNPNQGQDGFVGRLTFAGQNKLGVAIRLEEGDDLEFLVQDDLSGITNLEVRAEGHIVEY